MARCYACSGSKWIKVDTWENGELTQVDCVCVRCRGTGTITGGPALDDILLDHRRKPDDVSGVCICNYAIWGPTGNPDCPAA